MQSKMTGPDWLSDRERRAQAKAETNRNKAGIAAAKKVEAAVSAVAEFLRCCNACRDGSGDEQRGISDGRHILMREMREYAGWLDSKYVRNANSSK